MPRLSIVLPEEEHQALCDLALREWREPREQAGYMIAEGLKQAAAKLESKTAPSSTASAVAAGA